MKQVLGGMVSIPIGLLVLISFISASTSLLQVNSKENCASGFFSFDITYTGMVFIFCYDTQYIAFSWVVS